MSASQLILEIVLGAFKVLVSYGQVMLGFLFLFAAGMLFIRTKSVATGVFFGGLLITTLISLVIRMMVEFQSYDSPIALQEKFQMLSTVSFIAMAIQVTGFLVYVLSLPKLHDNNADKR